MAQSDSENKHGEDEARQFWDEARRAHDAGNYARVRALDKRVIEMAGKSDLGRQAAAELDDLALDTWALYAGLGFVVLYLLAWAVALS